MSSELEDNLLFSKSNRTSEQISSLVIGGEELNDVQSIGTVSVFGSESETRILDEPSKYVSEHHQPLDSLHSSMQSSNSPRQSLNLTVQSLNTSQSMHKNESPNDKSESRKSKAVQYALYSLLSIVSASIVMIIWYTSWSEQKTIIDEIGTTQTVNSNYSNCQVWDITGDGFCDDEANTLKCGYDFNDCCQMGNDRTLCEDCFCFASEDERVLIQEKHFKRCSMKIYQHHLGNELCDLNRNNEDHFFDAGDCCLEDVSCQVSFFNITDEIQKYCPENPCIKSNIFCVQEELGNGRCEDYNNGPYCDYDLGDCCLSCGNSVQLLSEESDDGCCVCSCKQADNCNTNHANNWIIG